MIDNSIQFRSDGLPPEALYDSFVLSFFKDLPEMPAWWSPARDRFLREQLFSSALISGIVYGETTRVKNLPWHLKNQTKNESQLRYYQKLLETSDFGNGFRMLLSKLATDLLTQDNGAFIEIIGENGDRRNQTPLESRPSAIAYLDAGQCWRTYDPEYPVIYTNPYSGKMYIMHHTRVITMSSFPQGMELARNLGFSALSRAYETIRIHKVLGEYQYEKITGQSPNLGIVNGISLKQFSESVKRSGGLQLENKGALTFKDTIFIGPPTSAPGVNEVDIKLIPVKSLPDGWELESVYTLFVYVIALAFGVDAREFWPMSGVGSTKADAEIQHQKATGKGRADIMQIIEDAINYRILPPSITFQFDHIDDSEDLLKAEIKKTRIEARNVQIQNGELSIQEARIMASEEGDIDASFLVNQSVSDDTDSMVVNETSSSEELIEEKKSYNDIHASFWSQFLNLLNDARNNAITKNAFINRGYGLLDNFGRQFFIQGFLDAGVNVQQGELDADERKLMLSLISQQQSYLKSFADRAFSLTFEEMLSHLSLWSNKGMDGIYERAKIVASKNKMMRWKLGPTEHCETCLAASEQIHRAATWEKYGLYPRSSILHCGGFRCQCSFEETKEKAKGKIKTIPLKSGEKWLLSALKAWFLQNKQRQQT